MAGQLGCLVSLGDFCWLLWDPWGCLGHLLRVTWGALAAFWESQGTFQGRLRLAFGSFGWHWGTAWGPLGCLTRALGDPGEVSRALGGLGAAPREAKVDFDCIFAIKHDVPKTTENL